MSTQAGTDLAGAARCLALDAHGARVLRAFRDSGIDAVLLKGPGLAHRLYSPDVGRRRYSDVDVLVRPVDFTRAENVLAGLGHHDVAADFPRDEWLSYERSWRSEPGALTVDLHRGFAGVTDPDAFAELLLGHTEPLALAGTEVLVPDVVGCALLVALHAASPGRGRKALLDLSIATRVWPRPIWDEAAAWARRAGAEEAFATGLRRNPEGAVLAQTLALEQAATPLARLAERLDLVLLHRALHMIGLQPDRRSRLRYIARRLVPTPGFLRMASTTAARGRWGLVAAYALRPARLLRPAPRVHQTPRRAPSWRLAPDPRRWTVLTVRTATWTWRTLRQVRAQVVSLPLSDLTLPVAPPSARPYEPTVRRWLKRCRATCLERALVLQRWRAGQGLRCELVVGVTAPTSTFRAHAWLSDDREAEHQHSTMTELLRRPTPEAWLGGV